ncbi:MAG: DUF4010 domain-containing protein, partial [Betaproteobacteria bacterium]|nr:DUF4010 domain-containing protein [Betaproteobacteria bacterium]
GFALLLTAVSLGVAWVQQHVGSTQAGLLAALAGFADAHAASASLAGLAAAGRLTDGQAAWAILAVLSTNTVSKMVAAAVSGHARYAGVGAAGLALITAAAWAAWLGQRALA